MTTEWINNFLETQLATWQLAKSNFDNLRAIKRKSMPLGDLAVQLQLNPARVRSTGASVDKASIEKRPCFLCSKNRPKEQISHQWLDGWELLVNPYPILPVHFTIPSTMHQPQAHIPLDMIAMADEAPDLAIFFNGARAGASAPDHLHCQAVLKKELPLLALAEQYHTAEESGWKSSEEFGLDLPFQFMSAVVKPDPEGMRVMAKFENASGMEERSGKLSTAFVNAFAWKDDKGYMRLLVIPRKAHRPSHYFLDKEPYMVSPGALDMAGLLILPVENDFERMTPEILREIYAETAYTHLPEEIKNQFK